MKEKILNIVFISLLFIFFILGVFLPKKEISITERRKLERFPSIIEKGKINKNYFEKLNKYTEDHFPFRETFRQINSIVSFNFLNKSDKDGVFVKDNKIFEIYPNISDNYLNHFSNLLNTIETTYLDNSNRVYYSIIPDKMYYLNDNSYPRLNYEYAFDKLRKDNKGSRKEINVLNTLNLDSYYNTDIHFRQEKLDLLVSKLLYEMEVENKSQKKMPNKFDDFYGALYGKAALLLKKDTLIYNTNEVLDNVIVYNFEKQRQEKIYEEENLKHIDSYDIYLSGAIPIIKMVNPNYNNGRELIMFRDSFASSLAPMMIESYSSITLVDLRYISSSLLKDKIDFKNKDVLFLYSIPIIGQSFTLK